MLSALSAESAEEESRREEKRVFLWREKTDPNTRRHDHPMSEEELLALLTERNKRMHSPESVARGRQFAVRATDTLIVTYPKCGTTWVTAIVHALRTRGGVQDFEEITEVVPWDILALDCGQDLDADQVAVPRLFKSHEPWDEVAKGGKYVYVCRHPADALVSFYNFLPAYMHCEGIGIELFAEAIFGGLSQAGGVWSHFVGWIRAAREHPDRILVITFEDLKRDLAAEIDRISRFLEPDLGAEERAEAVKAAFDRSTYAYMSARAHQFDDGFVFRHVKAQIGFPPDAQHKASKVRKGAVGSRNDLPDSVRAMLETRWQNTVASALGVATYEDLVNDIIHAELQAAAAKP